MIWEYAHRIADIATLISFPIAILAALPSLTGWGTRMVAFKKVIISVLVLSLAALWLADIGVRAKWFEPTLHEVYGKTFMNERVPLDGYAYRHCSFQNVTFVINGDGPSTLEYNDFGAYTVTSDKPDVSAALEHLNALGFLRVPLFRDGKVVPPFGINPTLGGEKNPMIGPPPLGCSCDLPVLQQLNHIRKFPELRSHASRHRRGATQRLVNANEIVVHEVDRDSMSVVCGFLAECVRQPSEPPVAHAD